MDGLLRNSKSELQNSRILLADKTMPLCIACCRGDDKKRLERILAKGKSINETNLLMLTPLYLSCQNGFHDCTEFLLQKGVEPNTANLLGTTPLRIASENGNEKCVSLLLQYGADPNICDNYQISPLYSASQEGHSKCVELLLKRNANPNSVACNQVSSLLIACQEGYSDCVELLLHHGADPNMSCLEDQRSPIFICSLIGQLKCVMKLIKFGVNLEKINKYGETALMASAITGNINVLSYLLLHDINMHTKNCNGLTAIQLAHIYGRTECIAKLIEQGADTLSLDGLEFDSSRVSTFNRFSEYKSVRRKARYCEYSNCSSGSKKLLACGNCKLVHYCCIEHQKLHWREHKLICKSFW